MSTSYSPTPAILPASITLPQDLVDQRTAASVNVPFKSLADAIAYLNESVTHTRSMGCGNPVGRERSASAKTYNMKAKRLDPWEDGATLPTLTMYGERIRCGTPETGSNIAGHIVYDVTNLLIDGATVTRCTIDLANPNTLTLPGMMPAIAMVAYDVGTDTWSSLLSTGTQTDTSASVAAYNGLHDIQFTPDQFNIVDLSKYTYYVVVCPEGGTNGIEGLSFYRIHIRQTARRFAG